jgi:cytochrome P450
VRDEIVTFIVAGHETVASALTWSIMLAQANDTDVLAADSAAIFAEALRLYPPAWLITRSAIADDEFDGITIPAGSLIIMSPYLLQRGATWTEPESFHPERFVNPQDQIARADYLPFGLGSRMCIGRDMALLEGPQILQKIARDFTITPVSEWEKAGVIQGVTLTPAHPVLFTAAAR